MDVIRQALPRTADLIAADRDAGQHKGFQLYVSLGGETIVNAASGEASPGIPMTPDTLVCWLSSGKPLTAMAIGLLKERGRLNFDDPVARHVPEFGQNGKDAITIRHLLTHTGGIRNVETGYPQATWDESLAVIFAAPIEDEWGIGETAGYHPSSSWFVLGEIIQRISGQQIAKFLRDEICGPLGMRDTWLAVSPAETARFGDRIGWTWKRSGRSLEPLDLHEPPRLTQSSPGSSARGPIRELGAFYGGLLASLRGEDSIFASETVREMTSPQRVDKFDKTFQHTIDFGLGFLVDSNRHGAETVPYGFGRHSSPHAFGHGGAQSSVGFADPEHDLVVAWAFNTLIGEPRHNIRNRAINTAIYEDLGLNRTTVEAAKKSTKGTKEV